MKLVTQSMHPVHLFGEEEAVRQLAKAGFDAIDWSFFEMDPWMDENWKKKAARLKEAILTCGLTVTQAHAPFPSSVGQDARDDEIMRTIHRSMEAAAFLGAGHIVVHPKQHMPYATHKAQLWKENVAMYRALIPYCEQWGIKVCCENLWQIDKKRGYIVGSVCGTPDEFAALLDEVNSPWIVGCLDLGHSALVGVEPADFIRALGKGKLQALHVHDVNYRRDCHNLPFTEKLDWDSITAALREIGYQGEFTFEADNFLFGFPKELYQPVARLMVETGRYLIRRIEKP